MELTVTTPVMKQVAKNLALMIKQDFSHDMPQSESYERVAKLFNFPNWDTAAAAAKKCGDTGKSNHKTSRPLSKKDQIVQLMVLRGAFRQGIHLSHIATRLANQSKAEIARAWEKAAIGVEQGQSFQECIAATGFFDEEVLFLLNTTLMGFGESIDDAISYLRMFIEPGNR